MVTRRQLPIINHTMIHSIVPSPSGSLLSVPPGSEILERKLELSRERSPLPLEERLPRPREEAIYHSWNLPSRSPLACFPRPHGHRLSPTHASTCASEPSTFFIHVRSFPMPLDTVDLSRCTLFLHGISSPMSSSVRPPRILLAEKLVSLFCALLLVNEYWEQAKQAVEERLEIKCAVFNL